jgi:hypothetical protein
MTVQTNPMASRMIDSVSVWIIAPIWLSSLSYEVAPAATEHALRIWSASMNVTRFSPSVGEEKSVLRRHSTSLTSALGRTAVTTTNEATPAGSAVAFVAGTGRLRSPHSEVNPGGRTRKRRGTGSPLDSPRGVRRSGLTPMTRSGTSVWARSERFAPFVVILARSRR